MKGFSQTVYRGWIKAPREAALEFAAIEGLTLGRYDDEQGRFESCTLTNAAFDALMPSWGKYTWELKPCPNG